MKAITNDLYDTWITVVWNVVEGYYHYILHCTGTLRQVNETETRIIVKIMYSCSFFGTFDHSCARVIEFVLVLYSNILNGGTGAIAKFRFRTHETSLTLYIWYSRVLMLWPIPPNLYS